MAIKKRQQEIILLLLIVIVFFTALYASLQLENCYDIGCFKDNMLKCKEINYVNEEPQASWKYHIIGSNENECDIEVTLLNAKEGELGLREYEGKSMICSYEHNFFAYPEKNLDFCHGELKEGLQTIIIEKLYKYIVGNLQDIKQELGNIPSFGIGDANNSS